MVAVHVNHEEPTNERILSTLLRNLETLTEPGDIAGVSLFGSRARGDDRGDSDYDILILHHVAREKIKDAIAEAVLLTSTEFRIGIEPVIMRISDFWWSNSHFLERIRRDCITTYQSNERDVKTREALMLIELSDEFIDTARLLKEHGKHRGAVDISYNAAELAVRSMLLHEGLDLPSSHGGVISEFGRVFIVTEKLDRALGKALIKALEKRNRARYEPTIEITEEDCEEILVTAEKVLAIAKDVVKSVSWQRSQGVEGCIRNRGRK